MCVIWRIILDETSRMMQRIQNLPDNHVLRSQESWDTAVGCYSEAKFIVNDDDADDNDEIV